MLRIFIVFLGYPNFLEDLRKPRIPFDQLKEMDWDKRTIEMNNSKILQQIKKYDWLEWQRGVLFSDNLKYHFTNQKFRLYYLQQ